MEDGLLRRDAPFVTEVGKMTDKCPACSHALDEQGTCRNTGMYYVCFYRKDPNGTHYLVVSDEIDPDTDKLAWEIEHPIACPKVSYGEIGDISAYIDHACEAREMIFEGMAEGDEAWKKPGRYLIEVWSGKSWTDYGWEVDGGVYLIPAEACRGR